MVANISLYNWQVGPYKYVYEYYIHLCTPCKLTLNWHLNCIYY